MTDPLIYFVHALFWAQFGFVRWYARRLPDDARALQSNRIVTTPQTAPHSIAVLALHSLAFGVMYFGVGAAARTGHVPRWFAGQRVVGTLIIACGAWLACWALLHFRSWRLRARLDAGHQLATDGPFHFVRHPIYLGLNLLALGTAVWIPSGIVWASVVLMAIGGDLRARAEEGLLRRAFGMDYVAYCARTCRFVPGIY